MDTVEQEQQSLIANDIRVLVNQLNDRIREATQAKLQVRAATSFVLVVLGPSYPTIAVEVFREVL